MNKEHECEFFNQFKSGVYFRAVCICGKELEETEKEHRIKSLKLHRMTSFHQYGYLEDMKKYCEELTEEINLLTNETDKQI